MFVRFFVDPVLMAVEIPDLLAEVDPDRQVTRVAFRGFGEEQPEAVNVPGRGALSGDSAELTAMAGELGHALFGDNFRAADFWVAQE